MEFQRTKNENMTRISIQEFTIEHAKSESYIKWLNDNEVTQFLGRDDMHNINLKDALAYYEGLKLNNLVHFYALNTVESNQFIGTCKISLLASSGIKEGICDLGIMIGDKRFWGKGYGGEAINIISRKCFNELNIRKITAGCYANNIAMVKAFSRNGFNIEGVLKKQLKYKEEYIDHVLFGCFSEDLIID